MINRDLIEDLLLEYIEEYGMLRKFPPRNDKIHYLIYCSNIDNIIIIQFYCVETINNLENIKNIIQKLTKRIKFFDESLDISYEDLSYNTQISFEITIK